MSLFSLVSPTIQIFPNPNSPLPHPPLLLLSSPGGVASFPDVAIYRHYIDNNCDDDDDASCVHVTDHAFLLRRLPAFVRLHLRFWKLLPRRENEVPHLRQRSLVSNEANNRYQSHRWKFLMKTTEKSEAVLEFGATVSCGSLPSCRGLIR